MCTMEQKMLVVVLTAITTPFVSLVLQTRDIDAYVLLDLRELIVNKILTSVKRKLTDVMLMPNAIIPRDHFSVNARLVMWEMVKIVQKFWTVRKLHVIMEGPVPTKVMDTDANVYMDSLVLTVKQILTSVLKILTAVV